jgi:hypothetical protein
MLINTYIILIILHKEFQLRGAGAPLSPLAETL